jgi:hypothetical protein
MSKIRSTIWKPGRMSDTPSLKSSAMVPTALVCRESKSELKRLEV